MLLNILNIKTNFNFIKTKNCLKFKNIFQNVQEKNLKI
jgi:hypothetical protein